MVNGLNFYNKGQDKLDAEFRAILEDAANNFGGFGITSGYRSPTYNKKVGGAGKSRHAHGDASDIDMSGWGDEKRAAVVDYLMSKGVTRFGTYTNSPNMMHIDMGQPAQQGKIHFMHDKTNSKMSKAPSYFKNLAKIHQGKNSYKAQSPQPIAYAPTTNAPNFTPPKPIANPLSFNTPQAAPKPVSSPLQAASNLMNLGKVKTKEQARATNNVPLEQINMAGANYALPDGSGGLQSFGNNPYNQGRPVNAFSPEVMNQPAQQNYAQTNPFDLMVGQGNRNQLNAENMFKADMAQNAPSYKRVENPFNMQVANPQARRLPEVNPAMKPPKPKVNPNNYQGATPTKDSKGQWHFSSFADMINYNNPQTMNKPKPKSGDGREHRGDLMDLFKGNDKPHPKPVKKPVSGEKSEGFDLLKFLGF